MSEPQIHSHITDELPEDHHLAFFTIYCDSLNCPEGKYSMLHAGNNECMQTWVESGIGNYCIRCFVNLKFEDIPERRLKGKCENYINGIKELFIKESDKFGFPEIFDGFLAPELLDIEPYERR